MKRTHFVILAAVLAVVVIVAAGCKDNRTMISSILQQPDKYMSKEVAVAGTVTKAFEVNLILADAGAYQVDDGSGKIWVITKTGTPAVGSKVGLKGDVSSGLKIGREIFGAVIREQDRRVR